MRRPVHRVKGWFRRRGTAVGEWLATPRGQAFQWLTGTVLTLVSIWAGHP